LFDLKNLCHGHVKSVGMGLASQNCVNEVLNYTQVKFERKMHTCFSNGVNAFHASLGIKRVRGS
jgi:hypothetical protein